MSKTVTRGGRRHQKVVQTPSHAEKPILFSYNGWDIARWDNLNMRLIHEDDDMANDFRWYSTLGGALLGLRKEIGFASPDLNAAIDSWDELSAKISALAL
jgi:hypothetical protein